MRNIEKEKIVIIGGQKLKGTINISGAKNAALPIIAASLLTKDEVVLNNIPKLGDVHLMVELLRSIGAKVSFKSNTVRIKAQKLSTKALLNNTIASEIRYSLHLLGALLPQFRKVTIPLPGGCDIGTRRIDSLVLGLTKLGAKISIKDQHIKAETKGLHGCHIILEFPSVSATETVMIASCLAEGSSIIENVAREPEIVDLALFLNSMGAKIRGSGTRIIQIDGVNRLDSTKYKIIPDRIETGTYIVAVAVTGGDVLFTNTNLSFLQSVVSKLGDVGVGIEETKESVHITSSDKYRSVDILTEVYPGFPTDMQPIITPLLCIANGQSTIRETIFDNRFNHVSELRKMGAEITIRGNTLLIAGNSKITGTDVAASDIRSGGALILAGIMAEGKTTIDKAYQIFRGYEDPIDKLRKAGAKLKSIS